MERGKEIKTEEKITSYLNEHDEIVIGGVEQIQYLEDDELFEKMYEFINSLDSNKLPDLQSEELELIKDELNVKEVEFAKELKENKNWILQKENDLEIALNIEIE